MQVYRGSGGMQTAQWQSHGSERLLRQAPVADGFKGATSGVEEVQRLPGI
ncbi:hypothetical protein Hdeb2414_s0011g00375411 [Helianthus debilis subsp. tardiflorus]